MLMLVKLLLFFNSKEEGDNNNNSSNDEEGGGITLPVTCWAASAFIELFLQTQTITWRHGTEAQGSGMRRVCSLHNILGPFLL